MKIKTKVDVIVVGAGFAGLYMLHRLRRLGFSAKVLEAADDVGGTWYWNRYPGARCDIESIDYSYSFDPELDAQWQWSERYATQPEILRYLAHVADKHDLRRDISFSSRVQSAVWEEATCTWRISTEQGQDLCCRFFVMASGCLSVPKQAELTGCANFQGRSYYTGRWPHEGADLRGKRVGIIGTGSSAIQAIPLIAEQAAQLTVFQRTPNFSRPAFNGSLPAQKKATFDADPAGYRESQRRSFGGVPSKRPTLSALKVSDAERQAAYETAYAAGSLGALSLAFGDLLLNAAANETAAEFIRGKIRSLVRNPDTAELLCPKDFYYGTKRPCLDTNYYQTFNLPHVRLVDLRQDPILRITEHGIDTKSASFEFDVIVFATGFDAMTGPIVAVDIQGRDGAKLKDKWATGARTYLGLTTAGFPNLFMITGPQSPSVLSNMVVSIEQHVDWVGECLAHMREQQLDAVEPTVTAESAWGRHVNDSASLTLFPKSDSWYTGANVPGKPREFLPYVGGVGGYRKICEEVVKRDYLGFTFRGGAGVSCNDGVIRPMQPDVAMMLEAMKQMNLPALSTLSVAEARAMVSQMSAARPAGPAVGEIVDGVLAGAAGELAYRLYRPATPGPHPIVAYFHGGGWVLGAKDSDEPFCRDLCVRGEAIVVSVDYRHAPEHRYPAAALDAFAAVRWIAGNAARLGGQPGRLVVCGWSAGGNIAAVTCRMARDAGGPDIAGQVLINPATDWDLTAGSALDNADGYGLTTAVLHWFWDHYADAAQRREPDASPLRARDLSNLPPALVVTCEFDPLRDQGEAYAQALAAAGVPAQYLLCRGHIHTSVVAASVLASGAGLRAQIAQALRDFVSVPVAAPQLAR